MSSWKLSALSDFISKVPDFKMPEAEKTLFSIGGRGYYENATSDILAFFMNPDDKDHGLGDLFLSCYFDAMEGEESPNFSGVRIEREVATVEGKRIDLQIIGMGWCLLIENKIRHIQNNPFEIYEKHALERIPGIQKFVYSVLSPDGKSEVVGWKGVSYRNYCQRLESALSDFKTTSDPKWLLFAKEFVLHLKNEVTKAMNPEQIEFVEKHINEVDEVLKLKSCYRQFLADQFKEAVNPGIPSDQFRVKDEGWAMRCYFDTMNGWNIALWWESGTNFMISVYMRGLSSDQSLEADGFFKSWINLNKEEGVWHNPRPGFERRMDAINQISSIVDFMCKLHIPEQRPIGY